MLLGLWELAACWLLCRLLCVTAVGSGGSGQPEGHNRVAAASSDLVAGAAAHRARGQGRRDAELDLLGLARVFGRRGDALHAERQLQRRVGARLRARVAADRAQGRSARPGAELGLLGGEAVEVIDRASRASNAEAVQHVRRARLGWLGLG